LASLLERATLQFRSLSAALLKSCTYIHAHPRIYKIWNARAANIRNSVHLPRCSRRTRTSTSGVSLRSTRVEHPARQLCAGALVDRVVATTKRLHSSAACIVWCAPWQSGSRDRRNTSPASRRIGCRWGFENVPVTEWQAHRAEVVLIHREEESMSDLVLIQSINRFTPAHNATMGYSVSD
jgi:hypothetical protein